ADRPERRRVDAHHLEAGDAAARHAQVQPAHRARDARKTKGRSIRGAVHRGRRSRPQPYASFGGDAMSHVIEHAASGRAKCRGCGEKIDKDELRFGEKEPNTFGDGEMTLWFHV